MFSQEKRPGQMSLLMRMCGFGERVFDFDSEFLVTFSASHLVNGWWDFE